MDWCTRDTFIRECFRTTRLLYGRMDFSSDRQSGVYRGAIALLRESQGFGRRASRVAARRRRHTHGHTAHMVSKAMVWPQLPGQCVFDRRIGHSNRPLRRRLRLGYSLVCRRHDRLGNTNTLCQLRSAIFRTRQAGESFDACRPCWLGALHR